MANNAARVASIVNFIKKSKGYDRLLNKVKIISAGDGNCTAEYKVEEEMTNLIGALHGGFSATLIDTISTYALFFANERSAVPAVSVDMHLTFLKGAKIGDEIVVEAKTLRCGQNIAYLNIELTNKETGELLIKGSHTKYLLTSKN